MAQISDTDLVERVTALYEKGWPGIAQRIDEAEREHGKAGEKLFEHIRSLIGHPTADNRTGWVDSFCFNFLFLIDWPVPDFPKSRDDHLAAVRLSPHGLYSLTVEISALFPAYQAYFRRAVSSDDGRTFTATWQLAPFTDRLATLLATVQAFLDATNHIRLTPEQLRLPVPGVTILDSGSPHPMVYQCLFHDLDEPGLLRK